eukprot:4277490-Pleurochrysis_carterae.AAC.1
MCIGFYRALTFAAAPFTAEGLTAESSVAGGAIMSWPSQVPRPWANARQRFLEATMRAATRRLRWKRMNFNSGWNIIERAFVACITSFLGRKQRRQNQPNQHGTTRVTTACSRACFFDKIV